MLDQITYIKFIFYQIMYFSSSQCFSSGDEYISQRELTEPYSLYLCPPLTSCSGWYLIVHLSSANKHSGKCSFIGRHLYFLASSQMCERDLKLLISFLNLIFPLF